MTEPYRYYVRSPDGRAIFGFESPEAAETAARAYGEGAHVIDTLAQAYRPMLQEMRGGEPVLAGFGGWDTGRFGLDRDLIEGIKKGHVAIAHAFLAKGADAGARDRHGGPALHWAVAAAGPRPSSCCSTRARRRARGMARGRPRLIWRKRGAATRSRQSCARPGPPSRCIW